MSVQDNTIIIRPEEPEDVPAVYRVVEAAFGRPDEAELVNALRAAGKAVVSLVAERDGTVVGHIFFSPATVETAGGRLVDAVGLAPMAVVPDRQRQGVGSLLVRAGLDACRDAGHKRCIVLGHPEYYPRFGFVAASSFGVRSTYEVPDEVFMAQEIVPGAFDGVEGTARYAPEFDGVD